MQIPSNLWLSMPLYIYVRPVRGLKIVGSTSIWFRVVIFGRFAHKLRALCAHGGKIAERTHGTRK